MREVYLHYAVVQVYIVQILINDPRVRKIFDISFFLMYSRRFKCFVGTYPGQWEGIGVTNC